MEAAQEMVKEREEDLAHEIQGQKMLSENKLILDKLKDQNSKLERMFLYLRECNIVGLGYNKENYMKRKSKILNSKVRKVVRITYLTLNLKGENRKCQANTGKERKKEKNSKRDKTRGREKTDHAASFG